jgi:NAD(P)H-hydrate repair Nnr-like enzyme with NAD(P)H-hydrate epimerase domain
MCLVLLDVPGEVVIDAMLGVAAESPLRGLPAQVASWLALAAVVLSGLYVATRCS